MCDNPASSVEEPCSLRWSGAEGKQLGWPSLTTLRFNHCTTRTTGGVSFGFHPHDLKSSKTGVHDTTTNTSKSHGMSTTTIRAKKIAPTFINRVKCTATPTWGIFLSRTK